MKSFKFHKKNLPLALTGIASCLIVFAHWTDVQTAAAVSAVTGIAAVLGWTE